MSESPAFEEQLITYRQHLIEEALIVGLEHGVTSFQAIEAVSSMLIDHPEIDADAVRSRKAWEALSEGLD